ncbi:RraA family protein|uniref:Putative 4-hydroxy-4-methyl-2-oxoglutarate aldolase n=1 Tax=Brenneria salicis ATCC 15712 = DSM 30166 TaxID=714314 RepID=A0A366IC18_9GAMM|nr:RraA family protein [Brenneria salicis]NMN91114.1 RraA family protein [Brenneria salicis ATCC 15712 = DSM 30166]RBP66615.1 RraA family protein [Brenneria salicis ATCC 15712 = DSM 30166]RLM31949.1 methyltransferase [Brenneria salicis ATCC 15712 = DSM 30166]
MNNKRSGWPAGFYIAERQNTLSAELIAEFHSIPVAVAGDCMGRITGATGLQRYHQNVNISICGPAITVKVRPGDNLMIHKALEQAQPGDVIVIDGGGDLTQALIGGLIRTTALRKKIAGFVVDGAIRDLAEWAVGEVPVFAKGHTHRGPDKSGPGEVNVPIACSGMVVNPGDLLLADSDGALAISPADVESVLVRAKVHLQKEENIRKNNASGTTDPERFNSILRKLGCPL